MCYTPRLDDSLFLVEQTTERVRDVTVNLRPLVLDDYGLVAPLHGCADKFTQRMGIAIAVEGEELAPRPIPRNTASLAAKDELRQEPHKTFRTPQLRSLYAP